VKSGIRKYGPGVASIAAGICVVLLLRSYRSTIHTYEVLAHLEKIEVLSLAGESGSRGFLITGRDPYLEPYKASNEAIEFSIDQFCELTSDNAVQRANAEELRAMVHLKFLELGKTVYERRHNGYDEAIAIIKTDDGLKMMSEIRRKLSDMKAKERSLLKVRKKRVDGVVSLMCLSLICLSALSLMGGFAAEVEEVEDG
jgi:CHASE3 domain sensor protein